MGTNDAALAQQLYERVKQVVPDRYVHDDVEWTRCGLNERWRWCKYVKGQKFGTHVDAVYHRNANEKSFYTVNVFLNDGSKDFRGGRTLFFQPHGSAVTFGAVAKPGLAVIFNQFPEKIRHCGEVLFGGVKYLMRTDVMYRRVPWDGTL